MSSEASNVNASIDLDSFDTLVRDPDEDKIALSASASLGSLSSLINIRRADRSSTLSIPLSASSSFYLPGGESTSVTLSNNSILCNSPATELDFTGVHYVESGTPVEKTVQQLRSSSRESRLMGLDELHQLRACLRRSARKARPSMKRDASSIHKDREQTGDRDASFLAQLPPPVMGAPSEDILSRSSEPLSLGSFLSSTHTLSGEFGGVMPFASKAVVGHPSRARPTVVSQIPRESVAVLIDAVRASTLQDDDKCRFVFDLFDVEKRGVLLRDGITEFVEATLLANNLNCYGDFQVHEMVDKLFAHSSTKDHLTYSEFRTVFCKALQGPTETTASVPSSKRPHQYGDSQLDQPDTTSCDFKPSIHLRLSNIGERKHNFWRRAVVKTYIKYDAKIHCLAIYAAMMLAAFVLKANAIAYDPAAGYAPGVAKGFAQVILVDACFLLLPMCRNLVTFLRRFSAITTRVPIDKHIEFHKICGVVMLIASLGHVVAWVCIIVRLRTVSEAVWQRSRFTRLAFVREETIVELLQRIPMWTGVVMVVIAFVAAPMTHAKIRRRNFNTFWTTHLLFLPFLLLILVHGLAKWVEAPQAYLWVLPPIVLYLIEKRYRMTKVFGGPSSIIRVHFSQDTVAIFMNKPKNFHFHPGMYLYLNVPVISRFEWHPFTISSAPEDDCISVHVRKAGDWTSALHDVLKTIKSTRHDSATFDLEAEMPGHLSPYPSVFIDGPIGAPSQDYYRYKSVVFVGAGIGVTPFASILRSIVHQWQSFRCPCCASVTFPREFQIQKIYFYWITRDQEALTWFTETMNQLAELDTEGRLEIHNYFSPLKRESVVAPLRALQTFIHDVEGQDIISGLATRQVTHFGRPDWKRELRRIAKDQHERLAEENRREHEKLMDDLPVGSSLPQASSQREDVAVFFCGPKGMGHAIHDECVRFNTQQCAGDDATITSNIAFDFRSENF